MSKLPTILQSKWPTVLLSPISISNHIITVTSTVGLHTKQKVRLSKINIPSQDFIIKRIISDTQLQVGQIDTDFVNYENPVQFDGGRLEMYEQERDKMSSEIVIRAVYEEEPAVALRNILVDRHGQHYTQDNPLPVSGSFSIEIGNEVEIKNDVGNPVPISGSVDVNNFPAIQPISGSVDVNNFPAIQEVSGTVMATQGTDPWMIGGKVTIDSLPEVEIKNDLNNPIPISKNTSVNSNNNPIFVKGTSDTSFFAPTQTDAFGRLRVSTPFTLFDSSHRYQDNGKINEYTSGTASSSHTVAAGSILMSVGSTAGDAIYRESSRVFAYQPGKSLLVLETFVMNTPKAGLRQRIGYFDINNGLYVELDGNQLSFVKRSSVTGTLTETRINQEDWSEDTLINGSPKNPSGINLNVSSRQIFWMDVEWLGVGSVRMGFVIDGKFIHCHTFNHANEIIGADPASSLPYISTACLPVRSELENTVNTSGPSLLRIVCSSVISEGGYELRGKLRTAVMPVLSPKTLPTAGVYFPILSIRLKSDRLGAIVLPKEFNILPTSTGSSKIAYKIISGATLTGASWQSAGTDSNVEYDFSATAISGGTDLTSGLGSSSNQSSPKIALDGGTFKFQLERNSFTGTAYTFTIVVASSVKDDTVVGSLDWEEIT